MGGYVLEDTLHLRDEALFLRQPIDQHVSLRELGLHHLVFPLEEWPSEYGTLLLRQRFSRLWIVEHPSVRAFTGNDRCFCQLFAVMKRSKDKGS